MLQVLAAKTQRDLRPTILDWLLATPGAHTIEEIAEATGYAISHVRRVCEWLVRLRRAVRHGPPRSTARYEALIAHHGGFRTN
jgi:IclR helix-turn-helix domain